MLIEVGGLLQRKVARDKNIRDTCADPEQRKYGRPDFGCDVAIPLGF
jgi:hypothetical protein